MKKIWHSMLCGGALAALLCTPALAAEEGDFSLVVNGEPVLLYRRASPIEG